MKAKMKLENISIFLSLLMPLLLVVLPNGKEEFLEEDCKMSLVNEVTYSISSKTILKRSQSEILQSSIPVNTFKEKGILDICVDKKGLCLWTLHGHTKEQHMLELQGMQEVVEVLQKAMSQEENSLTHYIGIVKKKNATIKYLGNGTCSVRSTDPISGMTSVNLLDLSRNMLLGSSVYDRNNELMVKLVCKYKNTEDKPLLDSTSLFYFEMDQYNSKLSLTEVVSKYN